MITNKNEAFHHNSCKKLAQLSKVIFAMNCLYQDQKDQKNFLFNQFEDSINDINEKHIEELNNIVKLLFQYRKHRINKVCTEFGASYKDLKADFVDYFNSQANKFLLILNNIKEAQEEIKTYQVSSLQTAASFFENSDKITNDLIQLEKVELDSASIKKSISPILKKIDLFNKQSKEHLNEIKENHIIKKKELAKENQFFIQQELRNYCLIWKDFLNKLSPIKSEINNFNDIYNIIYDRHSIFFKSQFSTRNQIIKETNQELKDIANQKNALLKLLKECSSKHQSSIQLLAKDRHINITKYHQNFTKLQQEINHIKHIRHQFQRSYSSRNDQLQTQFNSNSNLINQQFLTKRNNLLELQANNRKHILLGLKDLEHLLLTVSSLIKKSLDNERYKVSKMNLKIQQMQINQNSISEGLKSSYINAINQQNEKIENCLQKIFSLNKFQLCESQKVEKLRSLLKSYQFEMDNELNSYRNKYHSEYQNAFDNYQKLLLNKKEKLDSIYSQKVLRKTRNFDQTKTNFSDELKNLSNIIKTKNENVIKEEKNSIKMNLFHFVESQNHQMELNKINGRLEYYNQSVVQAKQVAEMTIDQLNHEISSIDKKIRKFKRSVKSTIQNIDQEYEMKIQVLQIDLNNKIENLSKLFTKEENDKGCQIIESIRKIRETENQKLNKSMQFIREREHMMNQFDDQIKQKKQIIQDLKNNKKEKEIKEKINSMKSNLALLIETETDKLNNEKDQISSEILKTKKENSNKLKSINDEIENEKNEFDSKFNDFVNKKSDILKNSEEKIMNKNKEFEQTVENMKINHKKEVDSLKRRIEFAKKVQNEEIKKQKSEVNELNQKCQNEIDNLNSSQNSKQFNNHNENGFSNELFDNKFIQLINRQLNLFQSFLLKVEENQTIQSKRLRLEFQAVKKTEDLSKEFSIHFQNMTSFSQNELHSNLNEKKITFNFNANVSMPNENKDESNGDIRNQLFKRISQNIESPLNSGNISESNSHKKMPTLVTPRLAA